MVEVYRPLRRLSTVGDRAKGSTLKAVFLSMRDSFAGFAHEVKPGDQAALDPHRHDAVDLSIAAA